MGFRVNDKTELWLGDHWEDITAYVYERDPITITRGQSANATSMDPSQLSLTLDDRDGRFSSRNPMGSYYGHLSRNTPIRVSLPSTDGVSSLRVHGGAGDYVSTSSAVSVTGSIDIRVDAETEFWDNRGDLVGKYDPEGNERSWFLGATGGTPNLIWSPDGTFANRIVAISTQPLPSIHGRVALRATLDTVSGTVKFYTADTIDGPWIQLGSDVSVSAGIGIHDSAVPIQVGAVASFTEPFYGRIYAVEVRDGLDGVLVANPVFTDQEPGRDGFSDAQGNVWTHSGMSEISDRNYRFYGEVSKWPQSWDVSGKDRVVKIQAFGPLRRETLNAPPLRSSMYRAYTGPTRTNIRAYWPMEDEQGATSVASGSPDGSPMAVSGSPQLASDSAWTASDSLPVMGSNGKFIGQVPIESFTNAVSSRMFVWVKEPVTDQVSLLKFHMSGGTLKTWDLRLTPNGSIRTLGKAAGTLEDVVVTDFTWNMNYNFLGFTCLSIALEQQGPNQFFWLTNVLDFRADNRVFDSISTQYSYSEIPYSGTVGNVSWVEVGAEGGLDNVVVGHLAIGDSVDAFDPAPDWFNLGWWDLSSTLGAMAAHNGESPGNRMYRLTSEEDVSLSATLVETSSDALTRMGDQRLHTLMELVEEAATTDAGLLVEARDSLAYHYLHREYLVNQEPKVTLDYSVGHIAGELAPLDDDTSVINDLSVKREDGSSVHMEETNGPVSVLPPDEGGVGRYTHEMTVSMENDEMLPDFAGWLLHMGTVDEVRFPHLTVAFHAPHLSDTQREALINLDIGSRLDITGFSSVVGLPPDDVPQLVLGYTETIRLKEHTIKFNLTPYSPYVVGVVDEEDYGIAEGSGNTLAESVDSANTALTVDPGPASEWWTQDVADCPFDVMVGGERCTVESVTLDSPNQVLTVIRSVNGIAKSHDAGTSVEVAQSAIAAY